MRQTFSWGVFPASSGHLNILLLCVLVVIGAVVGDSVGYEVGRVFGPRIVRSRLLDSRQARLAKAQTMLREKGRPAVFLGRFTAFFRAVMPCLVGHYAGAPYEQVARQIGTGSALVIVVLMLGALVAWHLRRRTRDRAEEEEYDESDASAVDDLGEAGVAEPL